MKWPGTKRDNRVKEGDGVSVDEYGEWCRWIWAGIAETGICRRMQAFVVNRTQPGSWSRYCSLASFMAEAWLHTCMLLRRSPLCSLAACWPFLLPAFAASWLWYAC